ncbi:MAG: hypothetical protein JWQ63_1900 [Mucilaginibacter sp.]|jgi:hypothetical protein|nr:hypothetical protein [Mucilaginibacter sp.]
MNWKIIFQLSIFGLIMAFATVSLIPEKVEPAFWLLIFIFCAYVIAKVCPGKYFLHGFLVSMVNCIWITAVHIAFRETYEANHPQMASMGTSMPSVLSIHPRLAMAIMGPIFGAMFGIILGLFSFVASKIVKKEALV